MFSRKWNVLIISPKLMHAEVYRQAQGLSPDLIVRTLKLEPHPEGGYFRETFRDEAGPCTSIFTSSDHRAAGQHDDKISSNGSSTQSQPGKPPNRATSTLIYFLLEAGKVSHLHRIDATEGWHFYAGSALEVVQLPAKSSPETNAGAQEGATVTRLGLDLAQGERPQCVVPGGRWFGARVAEGGSWSLVGCSVAPAFDFERFELGKRGNLLRQYPACEEWVRALTTEDE